MTALDPTTATRVLTIPAEVSAESFGFGGVSFTKSGGGTHPITTSIHGFPAIPRGSSAGGDILASEEFLPAGDFTLIIALEGVDTVGSSAFPLIYNGPVYMVFDETTITALNIADCYMGISAWPTALPPGAVVIALTANSGAQFAATSMDGIIASVSQSPYPSTATMNLNVDDGGSTALLLGMWLWEGTTFSETDLADTATAIAATYNGEEGGGVPSTIGAAYQAAVVQAVLGNVASGVLPTVLWGAWLDADLEVLDESGIAIPQDTFGATPDGVANTAIIDGGPCPATIPAHFALMDAAAGGQIVAYAPVTFDAEPSPGDALAFAPGELTFSYGA